MPLYSRFFVKRIDASRVVRCIRFYFHYIKLHYYWYKYKRKYSDPRLETSYSYTYNNGIILVVVSMLLYL